MLATVKGIFKDGKVELLEFPKGVSESNVVVTFLDEPVHATGKMMRRGILKGLLGDLTEADFKSAEFDEKKALEKWNLANQHD